MAEAELNETSAADPVDVALLRILDIEIAHGRFELGFTRLGRPVLAFPLTGGAPKLRVPLDERRALNVLADYAWHTLGEVATAAQLSAVVRVLQGRAELLPRLPHQSDELLEALNANALIATLVEFMHEVDADTIEESPEALFRRLRDAAARYNTLRRGSSSFPGAPNWLGRALNSARIRGILLAFGIVIEFKKGRARSIVIRRQSDDEQMLTTMPSIAKPNVLNALAQIDGKDDNTGATASEAI